MASNESIILHQPFVEEIDYNEIDIIQVNELYKQYLKVDLLHLCGDLLYYSLLFQCFHNSTSQSMKMLALIHFLLSIFQQLLSADILLHLTLFFI